jgi:hypothetical protein
MKMFRTARFWQNVLIILVFLLGAGVRMLDLQDPPLDFHPVRQLRDAIIARGLWLEMNPSAATPEQRVQAIQLAAIQGAHEPPIFERLVALTYLVIGSEQVWVARIYAILVWMLGGLALYRLARRIASPWAALLGLCFYLFLPFGVQASRAFQPDPWMVGLLLVTAWLLVRWLEKPTWGRLLALGLVGSLVILIKIVAGFFVAAMMIGTLLVHRPFKKLLRDPQVYAAAGIMLLPAIVYYLVFLGNRAGEYASFWTVSMAKLLLTSNYYADWLAMIGSLTGLAMAALAVIGLALMKREIRPVALGLWIGYVLYGITWPFQYTTHEYYHLSLVAIIGMCLPPVLDAIFNAVKNQPRIWRAVVVLLMVGTVGYWAYVSRSVLVGHNYANEPVTWQRIGEAIPTDGSFVLLTNDYGVRLGYYGWRSPARFWPSADDLMIRNLRGADSLDTAATFEELTTGQAYFVVTADAELQAQPELQAILNTRPLLSEGDGFQIYQLSGAKP